MEPTAQNVPGEQAQGAQSGERKTAFTALVPLDGSDLAERALPVATAICAAIADSEVVCLSALPMTALPPGIWLVPPYLPGEIYQQMWDDQEHNTRDCLASAVAEVSRHGVRARAMSHRGDAATVILDTATRLGAQLIIITSHGRTGLARFTLGSVADRIVRGSVAPVLLLRSFHDVNWSGATLRRALVPLDGSLLSETPLDGIIPQLAGAVIEELTLLRVVDPRDTDEVARRAESYLAEARQRLRQRLGERACEVRTLVRYGPVARTILDVVEGSSCGLVAMATYSEEGIGRLVLGSVTDRMLRDGQTPLLLAHPHP